MKKKYLIIFNFMLAFSILIIWWNKSNHYAFVIENIFKWILAIFVLIFIFSRFYQEIKLNKIEWEIKQKRIKKPDIKKRLKEEEKRINSIRKK